MIGFDGWFEVYTRYSNISEVIGMLVGNKMNHYQIHSWAENAPLAENDSMPQCEDQTTHKLIPRKPIRPKKQVPVDQTNDHSNLTFILGAYPFLGLLYSSVFVFFDFASKIWARTIDSKVKKLNGFNDFFVLPPFPLKTNWAQNPNKTKLRVGLHSYC